LDEHPEVPQGAVLVAILVEAGFESFHQYMDELSVVHNFATKAFVEPLKVFEAGSHNAELLYQTLEQLRADLTRYVDESLEAANKAALVQMLACEAKHSSTLGVTSRVAARLSPRFARTARQYPDGREGWMRPEDIVAAEGMITSWMKRVDTAHLPARPAAQSPLDFARLVDRTQTATMRRTEAMAVAKRAAERANRRIPTAPIFVVRAKSLAQELAEYVESAAVFVVSPQSTPLELLGALARCDRFPRITTGVREALLTGTSSALLAAQFSGAAWLGPPRRHRLVPERLSHLLTLRSNEERLDRVLGRVVDAWLGGSLDSIKRELDAIEEPPDIILPAEVVDEVLDGENEGDDDVQGEEEEEENEEGDTEGEQDVGQEGQEDDEEDGNRDGEGSEGD
jgi:hypothetical protein